MMFFNTRLARNFCFYFEVRVFTIVMLKYLAFNILKFILPPHFTIYPMSNVLFFLPLHLI